MRTSRIHPAIRADHDRRREGLSSIQRSRYHGLANMALENLSPRDIDNTVRRRCNGCSTTHTGLVVDLDVLRDRAAMISRFGHERARFLFALSPINPCHMQGSVRSGLDRIERMLDYVPVVIHQDRRTKGPSSIGGRAEPQFAG